MRLLLSSLILTLAGTINVLAGAPMPVQPITNVPTLGEWGMIAMFAVLGIVGFIALRKRLAASSGR